RSRQNQDQDGRFPWVAQSCLQGAAAFCTDGYHFFGTDHRFTGRPTALTLERLPSQVYQYEFAYVGLQSHPLEVAPGGEAEVCFFAVFSPDHPTASGEDDLAYVHNCLRGRHAPHSSSMHPLALSVPTLFDSPWLHGDELQDDDWSALFSGEHRHVEYDEAGRMLSFFTADGRHVVSRRKETIVERPHAHILRSGTSLWLDADILGITAAMAGIFGAQVYLGNTNLARFVSVIRNPLNVMRASGQRIFVKHDDGWRQLGVPSAFEMGLRHVRWLYRLNGDMLEVTCSAREDQPQIDLNIRVLSGPPKEFTITHQIAAGESEMSHPFELHFSKQNERIECSPAPASLLEERWPRLRFMIETDPTSTAVIGGDELLFADRKSRGGPYAVVVTKESRNFALHIRAQASSLHRPRCRPSATLHHCLPKLSHSSQSVLRLSDILPWFAHDAWIHFTAPHGLEQYGGAAWGTRDVCQGPVEWLLATRRFDVVRGILLYVFEQQYETGGWPQWFMFEPFRFIQSPHSHGDIMFWPVMALTQYIEATGDFSLLDEPVPYTDPAAFVSTSYQQPIAHHVEKVLAQYEARCLPGTALVNYGEGDWDDTLQPADPSLRSHMVSAWTVALAYDAFRRYQSVCQHAGMETAAERLAVLLERMRRDFNRWLVADRVVAGFAVFDGGTCRLLLHPRDHISGVRYRLLPMTRGVLSELFTQEQASAHLDIIRRHLLFPDGARLMSEPIPYRGGVQRIFKRAEAAANFGREIGLMYTHAHLRYAEALAKLGDAEGLWRALTVVNPIALHDEIPHAAPRQANVYFTSSDGAFHNRREAQSCFDYLRDGRVPVKAGWRLYSSGPGLFVHKVVTCLLGIRQSFRDVVFDPVLPRCLDGLAAELPWHEHSLEVHYHVQTAT
ncbi:MAG: GH36-type glycosyl hydrolase domain-containing protein, partial [Armatimonadota bacterium]